MEKSVLRKHYKAIRHSIDHKAEKSLALCTHACALPAYREAACIALFVGFGDELDSFPLLRHALDHKRLALPRVYGKQMHFHLVKSLAELEQSPLGIWEPKASAPLVEDFDLVFFPGLAFDLQGHRMGYGGGYYDSYFAKSRSLRIGLCFAEQIQQTVPSLPHDLTVAGLVTENGYIAC